MVRYIWLCACQQRSNAYKCSVWTLFDDSAAWGFVNRNAPRAYLFTFWEGGWLDCRGFDCVTSVVAVNRLSRHKTAFSPQEAGPLHFIPGCN